MNTLSHLIYTLPISGVGTASRTIGVNSQESIQVILFSESRLLHFKLMLCYIFPRPVDPRELIRDTRLNRVDGDARLTQRCCALPTGTACGHKGNE